MDQLSLLVKNVVKKRRRRLKAQQLLANLRKFTEPDGIVALVSLKCDAHKYLQQNDFLDELALVLHNYLFNSNPHVVQIALTIISKIVAPHCGQLKVCNLEHLLGSLGKNLRHTDAQIQQQTQFVIQVLDRFITTSVYAIMHDDMAFRFCGFEMLYVLQYKYVSRSDIMYYLKTIHCPIKISVAVYHRLKRNYQPPLHIESVTDKMFKEPDFKWISNGLLKDLKTEIKSNSTFK